MYSEWCFRKMLEAQAKGDIKSVADYWQLAQEWNSKGF
ncbi:hypothetical protein AAS23_gp88 [Pantoea phage vB_PagS_AAS23]|uniref:Uncharacterized protein n=1 Tax=Pantoea phage vB_PagS_AAS23 TaxID=2499073 RepID=A0A3S9U7U8_9CAUD|nr:hypothetical protein HOU93_gp88 [Pantoea phage vB_PagS_AAS23]AZS06401.1 hypothetical protein AAS23_gp88 [Pantoea phage vB_PagS_AAS23]